MLAIEDSTVPLPQSLTVFPPAQSTTNSQVPFEQTVLGARTSAQSPQDAQTPPLSHHQFLIDHVNLMRILQKALLELYSPRTASQSWQVSRPLHHTRARLCYVYS